MDPSARLYCREQSMRKWAFESNVLLYWLVRVVPTGGGPQHCAAAPHPLILDPGQLLWAVLD